MVIGEVLLAGRRWKTGPLRFSSPVAVIATDRLQEVTPTLAAAEEAARGGLWVAGFVSYQAAPGLSPDLEVPGVPGLPLVWFGAYRYAEPLPSPPAGRVTLGDWHPSLSEPEHAGQVEEVKRLIAEGLTYQVNLTFPITGRIEGEARHLLAAMLRVQPDSYGALIDLGAARVVSVSPELFLERRGRRVVTRPMKGTAPRGRFLAEDEEIVASLAASEKERSGNVMIVDMVRNDLGRVAVPGSVVATRLFEAERHPTVWQLTSTVEADLENGVDFPGLLAALFPAASVTGAPKVSTMSIIAELEPAARDVYCGAVGYLAPGATNAELSVAIRTGVAEGDRFTYHVGGGITFDSVAGVEYEECLWKALVVTRHREPPDLLETMCYRPGEGIPLLARHVRRLRQSAHYWGIEFDPARLGEALSAVEGPRPARVRLVLHGDGGVEVTITPMPSWDEPVPLLVSAARVDPSDPLWFHKTADRSRYPDGGEETEMILVNLDGEVTETNRSNIMARLGRKWVTPPVTSGCLPGVARGLAIAESGVRENVLTVDDLRRAEELAVTNALRGWRKAVLIG